MPGVKDVSSRSLLVAADILDPRSSEATRVWEAVAREKQLAPDPPWYTWLLLAGRGFGKTRTGAEWIDMKARRLPPGEQVLIAGRTPADVRDYSLHGSGGLLRHHRDVVYSPSHRLLQWPNGVEGLIRSGANPDEFRGYSGSVVWLDELCAWRYPEECWNNLMFGVREGDPQICVTTSPRPIRVLKQIMSSASTIIVRGSSEENRANLSDRWYEEVLEPLRGTRLWRQEAMGEVLEDVEGALWRRDQVEQIRVAQDELPRLNRVVVAVDPQGAVGASKETGVVGAAKGADDLYYVLADESLSASPGEWGQAVVDAYDALSADRVIGEVNYGGDMVEATIRNIRPDVSFGSVRATRGKARRAEPIAALYEQGKVRHVGAFPQLEDEMCSWTQDEAWSPNRLDALVWALTELSVNIVPVKRRRLRSYGG